MIWTPGTKRLLAIVIGMAIVAIVLLAAAAWTSGSGQPPAQATVTTATATLTTTPSTTGWKCFIGPVSAKHYRVYVEPTQFQDGVVEPAGQFSPAPEDLTYWEKNHDGKPHGQPPFWLVAYQGHWYVEAVDDSAVQVTVFTC